MTRSTDSFFDRPRPGRLHRTSILVVDDDATTRLVICAGIEGADMNAIGVKSGNEALAELGRGHVDAAVVDLVMPDMDGFTLCQRIRESPHGATLPILVLTGRDDDAAIVRAFDLGADDFATKPINPLVLAHRIRFLLRSRDTHLSLSRSRKRLQEAQRLARMGHFEWCSDRDELRVSPTLARLLEVEDIEDVTTSGAFFEFVHPADRERVATAWMRASMARVPFHITHRLIARSGRELDIECNGLRMEGEDRERDCVLGTVQDVTERRLAQQRLAFLTGHDGVTGLPSRRVFHPQAVELIRRTTEDDAWTAAVVCLHLDRFSALNELRGPVIADAVLAVTAQRLEVCLRETTRAGVPDDAIVMTRLGGDEFVAVILYRRPNQAVDAAIESLPRRIGEPIDIENTRVFVTASVGVARCPDDARDVDALLACAQAAVRKAKEQGRNQVRYYAPEMNSKAALRRGIEAVLREAMAASAIDVFFQPKLTVADQAFRSVEALVRLRGPDGRFVSPAEFLPVAEELGLMRSLDAMVIEKSCAAARAWRDAGFGAITVAVNLSQAAFWDPSLPESIGTELLRHGLDPSDLELELTETIVMDEPASAATVIGRLRELGTKLALDDFGTGYTSLGRLKELRVDVLKIDRAFVRGLPDDPVDLAIAKGIVAIARGLGLSIVAEGVETAEQADCLTQLGCHHLQGFHFAKPAPADEVVRHFRRVQRAGD